MKQGIFRAAFAIIMVLMINASVQAQIAYSVHTIASGESLSSLAKEYHTTVGDIMRLNDMHADSKLSVGQKIKIPATPDPVPRSAAEPVAKPQPSVVPAATSNVAQTYTVQSGESLYRISKKYNISVEKLMTLNHIGNGGSIQVGQVLIVSDGTPPPAPIKDKTESAAPASNTQPTVNEVKELPAAQPKQAPASTTPPAHTDTPANTSTAPANTTTALPEPAPVQKQSSAPVVRSDSSPALEPTPATFASNVAAPKEGYFTTQFRQNTDGRNEETKSGLAMTFKSASGWADKKFYILMNDAPPGSIVKVRNGSNAVYAKVLWSLGTQKENEGLNFRISTATAAALSITDEKFDITVTYFE